MNGEHRLQDAEGHGGRLIGALAVGLLLAVPIGALLSLAGLLVFYLGLFFFLLFGMMLGASMFRVLKKVRPVATGSLVTVGLIVALFAFGVSLWVESVRVPWHVAKKANYALPLSGERVTEANAEAARQDLEHQRALVAKEAAETIAKRYPPGGLIGYVRWAATDGKLEFVAPNRDAGKIHYQLSQGPIGFCIRLAICAAFICIGVLAQLWPLREAEDRLRVSASTEDGVTTPSALPPT